MTTLAVPETWSDIDLINRYKGALKWPRSTDAMVQSRSFEQSIIDNMAAELKRRGISVFCPKCKSENVSRVSNGNRCGACGHQY